MLYVFIYIYYFMYVILFLSINIPNVTKDTTEEREETVAEDTDPLFIPSITRVSRIAAGKFHQTPTRCVHWFKTSPWTFDISSQM